MVPVITNRHRFAVVEVLDVADDLSQDSTEAVADGDNSRAATQAARSSRFRNFCARAS